MRTLTVQIGTEPIGRGVVLLVNLFAQRVRVGPVGPAKPLVVGPRSLRKGPPGPVPSGLCRDPRSTLHTSLTSCFSLVIFQVYPKASRSFWYLEIQFHECFVFKFDSAYNQRDLATANLFR